MDIFTLFENMQKKEAISRGRFLQELRFLPASEFLKTNSKGQNILHKVLLNDSVSYDTIDFILKTEPRLANMPDKQGVLPAQVIQNNQLTAYRAIKALLSEKTDNLEIKKKLCSQSDIQLGYFHKDVNGIDEIDIEDCFDAVDIDEAHTLFKKPTLLCFSGRGAIHANVAARFSQACFESFHLNQKPLADFQVFAG